MRALVYWRNAALLNSRRNGFLRLAPNVAAFFTSEPKRYFNTKNQTRASLALKEALADIYLGKTDGAEKIFKKMLSGEAKPDAVIFTALLEGYKIAGDLDKLELLMERMLAADMNVSLANFNNLLERYVRKGNMEKAEQVVKNMIGAKVVQTNQQFLCC